MARKKDKSKRKTFLSKKPFSSEVCTAHLYSRENLIQPAIVKAHRKYVFIIPSPVILFQADMDAGVGYH